MNGLYDEIRIILHTVWKRRWLALLVAWGVCALGWLVVSMIPNRYASEARIFVQMQSLLPDKIGITPIERTREVERVKRTLTSTVNLEKVVKRTSLGKTLHSPKEITGAAIGLKNRFKVVEQQENLFQITAEANMPNLSDKQNAKLSRELVQSLIDIFVEDNISGNRVETSQTLEFFDAQLAAREKQLREAEMAKVTFEQQNYGLLPGNGSTAMRRDTARAELNQIDANLVAAQSGLSAVNGQLAGMASTISSPSSYVPGGGAATARAAALEGQIAEAQSRGWTDSHPDMAGLQTQLASARAAAARESAGRMVGGSNTPNPAYQSMRMMQAERQASVSAMMTRRAQLSAELAQFDSRQGDVPSLTAEQNRLMEAYSSAKIQYDKLLRDRDDVRLRGQMQSTTSAVNFRVIDPPSSPSKPSAPDRPMLLTGVLLLGLIIGSGVAFLKSQLQTGFATAKRLAAASGLPVIGSITEVLTSAQREATLRQHKMFGSGAAALAGAYVLLVAVDMFQRFGVA
jgi:polysaccharide biosynthesis transport protein